MVRIILTAALLAATTASAAQPVAAETVALELRTDGRVIGTPQVSLRPGVAATLSAVRPGGYALRLLLAPPAAGSAARRLSVELSLERDGRWVVVGRPQIATALGQRSAVTIDTPDFGRTEIAVRISASQPGTAPSPT